MIKQDQVEVSVKHRPMLTRKDLESVFRVSGRTIDRLVALGEFPAPFHIGRSCRWQVSGIEQFLQDRAAAELSAKT